MNQKREKILQSALKLFSQKDYEYTTVAEISTHAQTAKGLIYHYFSSKDSILDAIIYEGIPKNIERFGILDTDKVYPIEQIFHRTIDVCHHHKDYWRLVYLTSLKPYLAQKYLNVFYSKVDGPYLCVVENTFKSAGLKTPQTDAVLFLSMINGLLINMLFRNVEIEIDVILQLIGRLYR